MVLLALGQRTLEHTRLTPALAVADMRLGELLGDQAIAAKVLARQHGPGLHVLSWTVLQVVLAALAATLPTFASLAAAGAGATRVNGGPLGKTERCVFTVLATAFPGLMPILLAQLVNGSLITTALRLRSAHRELKARALADEEPITVPMTRPRIVVSNIPTLPMRAVAA